MKRTFAVGLLCSAMLFTVASPVHSLSKPSYSDADAAAIATALNAYNRADTAYNTALDVYNTANAAYNTAKTNLDNAKSAYDAAVIEYNVAAPALNAAILASNAATKFMQDCQNGFTCPGGSVSAVNDWQSKFGAYLAAVSRRDASIVNANTTRDAYNAAVATYNATIVPNNNAANNLNIATAVKTAAYNLYVETKATADQHDTSKFIPPKIPVSTTITSTTTNAPSISIIKSGLNTPAKKFKNCIELRKAFPNGVAKDAKSAGITGATVNGKVYKLNIGSDRDKDGVACELA
jgi:hypothetical protein